MPFVNRDQDRWKLPYTYALGLEDHPLPILKTEGLKGVTDAFNQNTMRLKRMMLFPAFVGDLAARIQRYTDIAEHEITGTVSNRALSSQRQRRRDARMRELLSGDTARIQQHASDPSRVRQFIEDTVSAGGSSAVILSAANPDSTEVYSLFCSYVTSMWTTFESLAGDL